MAQGVKIKDTYFETVNGEAKPKFVGGRTYPINDDTQRQVDLGNADLVEVPDDVEKAQAAADAAAAAAAKAAEKAEEKAEAATAAADLASNTPAAEQA